MSLPGEFGFYSSIFILFLFFFIFILTSRILVPRIDVIKLKPVELEIVIWLSHCANFWVPIGVAARAFLWSSLQLF